MGGIGVGSCWADVRAGGRGGDGACASSVEWWRHDAGVRWVLQIESWGVRSGKMVWAGGARTSKSPSIISLPALIN